MQGKLLLYLVIFSGACQVMLAQQARPFRRKKDTVPAVRPSYYRDHDTSYYRAFERYITVRAFIWQKFSGIKLENAPGVSEFRYAPHIPEALGIGATYQSISLNIAYGLGFLHSNKEKGKTSYLDIQPHIYGRKWTIDLLGQFYKGFYLTPKGLASHSASSFYVRPDMRMQLLGISAYRSLNPSRFSFRAALLENEQQLKSAGAVLIGAEIYYGVVRGDSSIVPASLSRDYGQKDVRRLDFIKIGPGVGYAYTYVLNKYFYATASLAASLSLDFSKQHGADSSKTDKTDLNKGFNYRIAFGYNRNNWNVNISLIGNQMTIAGANSSNKYNLSNGTFRINVAKRIKPGRWLTRKLHPVDKVIENVKGLEPPKQ